MNALHKRHNPYVGIQRAFEKALHTYDDEAIIQQQVSTLLLAHLVHFKISSQRVLDLGCGTGLMTMQLCKALHISSLDINDLSQVLLDKAHHRLQSFQPKPLLFNFDQTWNCKNSYDLIFSNMAFQWSFNILKLFKKCYNQLNKNGILAFSLPIKGSYFKLKFHQCISFHRFGYICQSLSNAGFKILKSEHLMLSQEFKTHLQALKSIKRCGANYVHHNTNFQLFDRSRFFLPSTLRYKIGIFIVTKS